MPYHNASKDGGDEEAEENVLIIIRVIRANESQHTRG